MNVNTSAPYTAFPLDVTFNMPDQQVGSTATDRDSWPASLAPVAPLAPIKPEPVNKEVMPVAAPPAK